VKIAMLLPGGVDRSGTHRVIPCNLWLIERVARQHELHVFAFRQEPKASRYELLGAQVHNIGHGVCELLPPWSASTVRHPSTFFTPCGRLHPAWWRPWPADCSAGP